MKKITLMAALLGSAYFANAQVGIGTPAPAESSMLHIVAADKGVIIPNVSLTSTEVYAPIKGDTETRSLLVYNTNTAGDTATTGVTPGFYYWENSEWQRITTKAELDAAVGNVTNVQNNINEIKKLLQIVYPANNLDSPTSTTGNTFGGGLIYSPTADSATGSHVGYVFFDSATSTYKTQFITLESLGFKEKVTELNGDTATGKYTYINEADSTTIIDIPASVVNNIQNILGDTTTINVDSRTFTTVQEYLQHIIGKGDANVGYTTIQIDTNTTTGQNVVPANSFYYVDANGNKQYINIQDFETLTKLEEDTATGSITYFPERGNSQKVSVVDMIVNNLDKVITAQTTFDSSTATTLVQYIQNMINDRIAKLPAGTVTAEADTSTVKFSIANGNGGSTPIQIGSFETIVKANETVTELTGDSTTGQYTYKNELDSETVIDVPGSVINNFGKIAGDSTTVVTINGKSTTINEFFNSLGADSSKLIDNEDGTFTFVPATGDSVTINIPASVVNNFTKILGDTTTYKGDTLTIEQIIEQIAASGAGNMIYVPGADSDTLSGSSFIYTKSDGDTETISFSNLIKANETTTTLTRNQGTSPAGVVITYDYLNEDSKTSTIDLTSDVKTLIEGNTEIKTAIENILNAGGNVYYTADSITADSTTGNKNIPANSFYTINNGIKVVVTVPVSIEQIVTAIQGADSTTINILKTELGDNFADSSTTNNIVKTGDTWIDGKAIYKGIYPAYIVGKTALVTSGVSDSPTSVATTNAISLEKTNVGDIISITVLNVDGSKITTSTTDVSVSSNALKFSIGTGNMYNVLFPQATSNTAIKVLVEFSAE